MTPTGACSAFRASGAAFGSCAFGGGGAVSAGASITFVVAASPPDCGVSAGEDASGLLSEMKRVSEEIKQADERATALGVKLSEFMMTVPNRPHASVPIGHDASANIEVRRWGVPPN